MIYGINDKPPFGKLLLFGLQLMLSVFVATVLIASICGVNISGALFGAGVATVVYLVITGWKSPMFISNSGAFIAPVMAALAAAGYTGVAVGGLTTCVIYCLFGLVFTRISVEKIYRVFPKALIGAVTIVIGITLMSFIQQYVSPDGESNIWAIGIALFTAVVIALISHYSKGIAKILPFMFGTLAGYVLAVILTVTGVSKLVDFDAFKGITLFSLPDLALLHWGPIGLKQILTIVPLYIAFTVSAMMECLADHSALGAIIGTDLFKKPGLARIFVGEGFANLASAVLGGQGTCSYGEGVACVGFSKVASTRVTLVAALMLIMLSFLTPVQLFIASIPSCVFAGAAIILYGYIACSGIRMLQQVDLGNAKNMILISAVLSLGISGLAIGGEDFAISGTALALVFGVFLNLILKEKKEGSTEKK